MVRGGVFVLVLPEDLAQRNALKLLADPVGRFKAYHDQFENDPGRQAFV